MAEALALAARIPRRPWPNPPVGAVVVRDGVVVGRGAHHGAGTEHAEIVALREAGDAARGATLYCTLEPCNHQGRMPPCAPAVVRAGIGRAVIAIADANPKVCGGGTQRLQEAGIDVRVGVMAAEALDLVWPFVATRAFERPFVLLKTATTIDGFFAPPSSARRPDEPFYLTGGESRRDVHRLRRWCDAVIVGERTMAEDRPQLDGRLAGEDAPCPAADPMPGYVDTDLSLVAGWSRPHWVFVGASARDSTEAAGTWRSIVRCDERDGHVDLASLLARFVECGGRVLMVEGGPTLAAAFLRAGLVDRWIAYTAPVVLGGGVRWPDFPTDLQFHLTRAEQLGTDAKAVWDRLPFGATLRALAGPEGVA